MIVTLPFVQLNTNGFNNSHGYAVVLALEKSTLGRSQGDTSGEGHGIAWVSR